MPAPRFGILILNCNGRRWLPGLYQSLRHDGYDEKRIYLVDNGSTDGSIELTEREYPEVAVLRMPRNMGYCMAYNLAMDQAFADGCDWVSWQNNDTLVLPGWLHRMAEVAGSDARVGVMGPVFREWDSDAPNHYMQKRHADLVPYMEDASRLPIDCDWVEGSACVVKRECVDDVGPLDPALFLYWEEADFCRRARRRKWRVVIVPGSVVRHYGGGDTSISDSSKRRFNALKTHNQYVYSLCDPHRGFLTNGIRTVRTFLVGQKQCMKTDAPLSESWRHSRVFLQILLELPRWYGKWARDRRGGRPPKLRKGYESCVASFTPPLVAGSGADRRNASTTRATASRGS